MTTNVSIAYANALAKYENAKTPSEKLAALEEMRSHAPAHKGGEKMRGEINRKISQLRADLEKEKKQAAKRGGGATLAVKKEGAGQVVLVGLPNAGKSTFFNALTGLTTPVEDYEFTTSTPEIGMVDFKGAKIQLVDLPPILEGSSEGKANGKEILAIVRNADAIAMMLNVATQDEDYRILSHELNQSGILLNRKRPNIRITPTPFPGISITGKEYLRIPQEKFVEFLKGRGMHNVEVILQEPTTLENAIESLDETLVYKRTMLVYTKGSPTRRVETGETALHIAWDPQNPRPNEIAEKMFEVIEKVYVYTKKAGEDASKIPLVAPKGATVLDIAEQVHKDIVRTFKYAKVWGSSKFEGQRVAKDYPVQNGDVIEFNW
ncbi:MAG: GTPase [Candidatus Diapherotrites archaeon]|nr:GTPase [Candidatus Diapherotrites archaeon]MDZ4256439.1 GTPase [archaeon]